MADREKSSRKKERARPGGADEEAAPSGSEAAIAPSPAKAVIPPTKASFDELARNVARAEPLRGNVMQPPPAWEPDEVTLGFAMTTAEDGVLRELPEPIVLATILIAVENDRRRILNRITGGADEEIDGVANLFWPLLILQSRTGNEVAIFDGTGVWKRTFRYTLLPPMDQVRAIFQRTTTPPELLNHMRSLLPYFGHDPGAEVLTVEGFLPVDPPLLFDVLSHVEFRSDPQSPHAGFLPARHDANWYIDVVRQMHQWLDRFEGDLKTLKDIREQAHASIQKEQQIVEDDYRRVRDTGKSTVDEAVKIAESEIAEIQKGHRGAIRQHLDAIRTGQTTVARGQATIATADALTLRAGHRRTDPAEHIARSRDAEAHIRGANRQVAEARKAIERIHGQERADLERSMNKVVVVEQQYAQALAERELFRDEFIATGLDLLQAVDGQLAARSGQKNLLAGYFLPLSTLANVRVVWFPLWTATLKSPRGVRQIVFPPMQVRSAKGISGTLKQLFGGVVLPLEPRTAQFDKVLRTTMEEALAKDPWLSNAAQELTRAADVLVDPDVLLRFHEGLQELVRAGWIGRKAAQEFLNIYTSRAQLRATRGAELTGPPLSGPPGIDSPSPLSDGSSPPRP